MSQATEARQYRQASSDHGVRCQSSVLFTNHIHSAKIKVASNARPARRMAHCLEPCLRSLSHSQGPAISDTLLPRANSAMTAAPSHQLPFSCPSAAIAPEQRQAAHFLRLPNTYRCMDDSDPSGNSACASFVCGETTAVCITQDQCKPPHQSLTRIKPRRIFAI